MEETGGSGGGMGCLAKLSPTPRTILLNRFVAALMPAAARASRRVGGRSGVRRCFLLQWLRSCFRFYLGFLNSNFCKPLLISNSGGLYVLIYSYIHMYTLPQSWLGN